MTEQPGVYLITHTSGKAYCGSTSNLSKRWSRHRKDLAAGKHPNHHLQAAWNRYGGCAFTFRVLAICEPARRIGLEQAVIDRLHLADPRHGYNRAAIAGVSYGGGNVNRSPAWRAARSEEHTAWWDGKRVKAGDICGRGHIIDGSQVKRRARPNGRVTVGVICQGCTREDSFRRSRERRGVPLDWPKGKHYNRR